MPLIDPIKLDKTIRQADGDIPETEITTQEEEHSEDDVSEGADFSWWNGGAK